MTSQATERNATGNATASGFPQLLRKLLAHLSGWARSFSSKKQPGAR